MSASNATDSSAKSSKVGGLTPGASHPETSGNQFARRSSLQHDILTDSDTLCHLHSSDSQFRRLSSSSHGASGTTAVTFSKTCSKVLSTTPHHSSVCPGQHILFAPIGLARLALPTVSRRQRQTHLRGIRRNLQKSPWTSAAIPRRLVDRSAQH